MTVRASACGKLILLGEHTVVLGQPGVAVPLPQRRVFVALRRSAAPGIEVEPRPGSGPALLEALAAAAAALGVDGRFVLELRFEGLSSGMGSSAALGVALSRALLAAAGQAPSMERVLAGALAVERGFHGNPSGIDHTVSAWERPVRFVRGSGPAVLEGLPPLRLAVRPRQSALPTAAIVGAVAARLDAQPGLEAVVRSLGVATDAGLNAWRAGDRAGLAAAMNGQERGLDALGVVFDADRDAVSAALAAGAPAAKITGAGAGGTVIALAPDDPAALLAVWGDGSFLVDVGGPGSPPL